MANENKISTSKKEIYKKLLTVAEGYLDKEHQNTDFTTTGLFGYVTESMAMAMRDSAYHTSMMYNESFLNTAIIPKSVYNWAKMFNIEVQKAEPAYAEITFIINAESLANHMRSLNSDTLRTRYGMDINQIENGIILDKEDPILAGEYYFSLEHSIVIYPKKDKDSNEEYYLAKSILSEYESTNYEGIDYSNNTRMLRYNNGNYEITARAYQYRLNKISRQLSSRNFLNKIQTYEFTDQFCGAKLFSTEGDFKEEIKLAYSDMIDPNTTEKIAFYNLVSDNELSINFKYGDDRYFMPGANSNLLTYIYTTKGRNIPQVYSGTAIMLISDTSYKSLPMTVRFNSSSIIGGKNIPSLNDIKTTIINEISTRNTITTQADLNNFFKIISATAADLNNGKFTFVKQRDDIIRRIYNSYLLLRDNIDDRGVSSTAIEKSFISACVPTNTMDVKIKTGNVKERNELAINSVGTEGIIKIDEYPSFKFNADNELEYISSSNATSDYYRSPFKMRILTNPARTVKFVYDLVDSSSKLNYNGEQTGSTFLKKNYLAPVAVRVYKTNINSSEEKYNFEITMTSNLDLNSYFSENGTFTISLQGVSGSTLDVENLSAGNIKTDTSSDTGNSVYTNIIYFSVNSDTTSSNDLSHVALSYNGSSANFKSEEYLSITLESDNNNFTMNYKTQEPLVFFYELDDIMESSLIVEESTNSKEILSITVKAVPLVHSSFFNSESGEDTYTASARIANFSKQLFSYIKILREHVNRLETSTFFSLKFYNTYGISYRYKNLSKTNITLQMKIVLKSKYSSESDALSKEIRSFIRRCVDKMNDTTGGIRYSDIIALLMQSSTYGQYIDHVIFAGTNDTYDQFIEPNDSDVDQYVPEWLNLDRETTSASIVFDFAK